MATNQFATSNGFEDCQLNRALDLLLIKLGGRSFGLSLSEVRHVCSMPPGFVGYGPETEKHFVFQGSPLPYASLWNQLGLESQYAEYEEMQILLPKRKQDHLDWMDALEGAIRNGTKFAKARHPRECAFGKWYYDYQAEERRLSIMLGQFEKPHAEIHRLADKLLGLVEAGQIDKALYSFQASKDTTLAGLLELFDKTQKLVTDLQRRAAVIVADGDDMCALGTDGVRDIVAVPSDRIKPGSGIGRQKTSALIVLDDRNVVPLINWRTFFADRDAPSVACNAKLLT